MSPPPDTRVNNTSTRPRITKKPPAVFLPAASSKPSLVYPPAR
nr:MAG TPA: hypothetical protein [Caudoviricetes sp.]DAQ78521.1 MAG TPA: hypothetical protein [Caudoviricetes sp.]